MTEVRKWTTPVQAEITDSGRAICPAAGLIAVA